MRLAFVYSYFRNFSMLAEHYRVWSTYPSDLKAALEVVVVDAGGDAADAALVPRPQGLPAMRIYRLLKHEAWNQDVARNLGAKAAVHPWLLLTDMDHVVPAETLATALGQKNKGMIYTFGRVEAPAMTPKLKDGRPHPHPNSFLMTRDLYWRIGGYDERLTGIYGTDGAYKRRARRHAKFHELRAPLICYGRDVIADASTPPDVLQRRGPENDREKWRMDKIRIDGTEDAIETLTREWERVL